MISLEQLDNDDFTAIIVPSNPEFLILAGQFHQWNTHAIYWSRTKFGD